MSRGSGTSPAWRGIIPGGRCCSNAPGSAPPASSSVEESRSDFFTKTDSDQDNYTQNAAPYKQDPRHGGFTFCMADGHAEKFKEYDFDRVTYYTDRLSGWLGTSWSASESNTVKDNSRQ